MLKACYSANYIEAGCDEAGRGCLAGPVVAAAVILPRDYVHPMLNDSKQLNNKTKELLKEDIQQRAISYAVAEVSNEEIDAINILKASFLAMHRAITSLQVKPEMLLIDGNRFIPYPELPHICMVKGDARFASIAAASVLAKTYRDELMKKYSTQYPGYGWEKNAGYPTVYHRDAIRRLGLTPLHRKSFRLLNDQLELF
ncbi:MAG: ribonuclease HII [Cyclobacteriaceae bacterium]|nr:ribonuclease HII [Cyclobacteriaceae bacterium]